MTASSPFAPATEEDLELAAENGVLDEAGGLLELKRELPSGRGTNAELARDLASLAVSGGLLLVGVNDLKDRPPALHPVPLHGLEERVEQIASSRCDPPLSVRIVRIPSSADPDTGYLAVHVPQSQDAPHMVDGRYWGRDERTKRSLTDREVESLVARRRVSVNQADRELKSYISRDPVVSESYKPQNGHFFLVAVPLVPRSRMVLDSIPEAELRTLVRSLVGVRPVPDGGYAPDADLLGSLERRSDGWGLSTWRSGENRERQIDPTRADRLEPRALEIELSEEGIVRLFCGRGTDKLGDQAVMFDRLVVGLTLRGLDLAAAIAERSGYWGRWALGLYLDGLQNTPSWTAHSQYWSSAVYDHRVYRELATASTAELADKTEEVANRLVGRLLRGYGIDRLPQITQILSPPVANNG